MNAENRFLFSSSVVIIFVVRHAANNKHLETDDCMCSIFSKMILLWQKKKQPRWYPSDINAQLIFEIF